VHYRKTAMDPGTVQPIYLLGTHLLTWHATFLSLLPSQLRAYIIYCHLHVTLNSSHDWERLLNILRPAIGQKSTNHLFNSLLVTIRPLVLSNLW